MILTTYKDGNSKDCKFIGDANNESSKFATRKCYVINDQNNTNYSKGNENVGTVKFEAQVNTKSVIIQMHIFL